MQKIINEKKCPKFYSSSFLQEYEKNRLIVKKSRAQIFACKLDELYNPGC